MSKPEEQNRSIGEQESTILSKLPASEECTLIATTIHKIILRRRYEDSCRLIFHKRIGRATNDSPLLAVYLLKSNLTPAIIHNP